MKNAPKLFSMYLKDNMGNKTISELYTDAKKLKHSSNPNNILKSAKNFIKIFSNEPPPIFLGVFHSWDNFDTIGVSSRTEVISAIYKKDDKKTLQIIDPFRF